ncbi:hypothetical protein AAG570_008079, partial [Ranatra chinensis]
VQVVDHYLRPLDGSGVPRFVSDKQDILFSNFKEIAVFHNTVLLEGIKYYAKEPRSLGRTFLRMERDFDKHVSYCHDEPAAQEFLQSNENVRDFFDDLGARLHDDKSLSEHLKLPIQRINDYQLLLKELVKYSERLGEDTTDLHKALELMLGIPTRAEDSKFITNIEGYHGDIHKLGRLLRHNWFKVKGKDGKSHDRYLFLFKARILICKVRKISKDRYVFVLKEIIRLPDIEVKDHKESSRSFEVGPYTLTSHQDHVKEAWLAEIKHYSKNSLTLAEHAADDLRLQEEGNKNILPLKGVELETPAHSLSNSDEEMDKFSASKRTSISRRVEAGGSAAFECEVDAESIVWLKDNKPIPDRLSGRITRSSVGSSHRLEITDVTESDAGVYTAHAKIPSGDVTSCTANLVVQAQEKQAKAAANAPVFLVRLKDTELLLETYLRFLIKVKGEPNPIVKFFKDDELISSKNERIKIDNEKASTGYYELIIPEVRKEDAGVYKCIASNKYGQVSCEGSVTVVEEKKVFEGIKEVTKGGQEPVFTWLKDGKPFNPEERFKVLFQDDQDSLALVFTHVKPEDAGLYTCVASTSSGKISCSAELTVQGNVNLLFREPEVPHIKSCKKEIEANTGSSTMLETKVKGYPKPEVKWVKDGKEIVMSDRFRLLYEDEETISLVIMSVNLSDTGEYKAVASNCAGQAEDTLNLTVKAPPNFSKKLDDVSLMAGKELKLKVQVEANPKPSVTWFKDGKEVKESEHIKIIEEGTSFTLLIDHCTLFDAGSYSVVCKNEISQSSEFCKVEVLGPPVFTRNLIKKVDTEEGDSLTFLVKVYGNPMPYVKWFFKGEQVFPDARCKISHDIDTFSLTVNSITRNDGGEYTCELTNMHGTNVDRGTVMVKCSPKITKPLGNMIAQEGDTNVGFSVDIDSYPKGKVRWFHNDKEITETHSDYTIKENESHFKLVLKTVTRESSGKFSCKIENDYGTDECFAELTVLCKPLFKKQLKDVRVDEGDTLNLQIEVEGTPEPQIKWFKDGQEVVSDAHIKITRNNKRIETYELTVNLIRAEDSGEYTVHAINEMGTAVTKSTVIVQTSPQITKSYMKDSDVYETWETSFKIEANGIPRPTAKWYRDGTELKPSEKLIMSDNCEEYSLDVLDCQLDDAGTYKVVVSNVLGEASESATLNIIPARNFRLPVIKTPLMDLSIPKDEKVVLTVVLSADPVPEITWKHDGKDISPEFIVEHDSKQTHHGLKECTYKLTILRGKHENTGIYSFHAANKSGEADCSARLDIVLQPEIKSFGDLTVIPYEDAQFVAVIHSNPRATITWRKDGNKISNDDHYVIETDSEKEIYKLRVKDILLEDAGVYTVSAVNSLGEASADAKLRIHTEMPRFTRGLENITVREYAQLDMKVRAEGVPKPEIQWSRNGVDLVESDGMTLETKCEGQVSSHLMIPHFKPDQAGKYTVRAYNLAGHADTTCDVILDLIPPRLSKSLERAVHLEEGDPLELRCKIEASPNATAKWLKDGEELKESDRIKMILGPDGSVRLHIDHCTPEDCGAYKLIISNVLGSDFSICAVAVTPNPRRPTFIKELKNIVITEGEPLLLEAKVMAFPLPELKWTKDGITVRQSRNLNFINSPGGIVGLSIDSVSPEHKGLYTLIAANKLGEATSDAMVEIKLKDRRPEFLAHLSPTTVVEGFPVKFNVKVVATPIPELIWSRNDTPVEIDGERIKVIELPDGEISLVINNTTPSDAGVYSVRAVNCAGAITSEAKLQVVEKIRPDMPEEKPDFIHVLRDAWAEEGSHLVFLIPYMGNPIPDVTWYKDGQLITPDDRIMITNDGNKVGLVINPCEMGDVGEYKCKLSSKLGEAEISASANVRKVFHAPVFIQKLQDLEQVTGLDGKLTCRVTGNPRPEIKWFKDNIPIFKSKKYSMKEDGENCLLCIRDCASEDEGQYSCVARNRDGEDKCEAYFTPVEKIATKIKGEAPCFLKKIGDQEVIKGITGRFTACISGYPEPEIEWYRNNERIYPSERITMEKETTGLIRLTVARIDPTTDCGTYRLRIHNDLGEDECEASFINDTIEVRELRPVGDQYKDFDTFKNTGAPVPLPDKPIISKMTDRRLTLSWKPSIPIGPREPVTYQVEMLELPNGEWFHVRSGIRSCTCEIRNLEPFRDYKFRVRVENKYGVSDPSPFAITHRAKLEPEPPKFIPYLAPGIDFRPETSPYFPKDFDIERPPHDGYSQAPRFLRQEQYTQYGVKGHSSNLYWFVYGYPKPKMTYYFNDELIEMGGRFDTSYTRNGQATLFINKMLDRDVGSYEAVATNEHGEARQRVHLEIAEYPEFIQRPEEITIFSRHSGKIEARVIGVPQPTIKWFKDWQPLAPTSRIRMHRVDPDHCSLTISDAISKDGGLYSITASNLAGAISSSVMVTIEEKDEHPFHIYGRGHNIKPKTILLREHYDLGDELGRGTQGVTYHSVERYSGRNYAAKAMYGRGELKSLMHDEIDIMNQLNHHKLIKIHDAYETLNSLTIITELAAGGELLDWLTKQSYTSESEIASYIRQLLCGLDYMHDQNIAHLGLNPGDLLLSHPGSDDLKLCDFGLSRRIHPGQLAPLEYGMPEFVSPETIKGDGVDTSSDMWSLGVITYLLLTGVSLFRGNNDMETLTKVREGFWEFDEEWWKYLSVTARDFITKLLVIDPKDRMSVKEALRHPWLNYADRLPPNEHRISTENLQKYYSLYKDWYKNASCRNWYRRRPLIGAFNHPSRMVYPPNYIATPTESPERETKEKCKPSWIEQLPSRQPLNYDMDVITSESHYQNGPDTYLLQLRDVDFPVRIREYMKVAATTGSGVTRFSEDSHLDWRLPVIRERRRFMDVMDEEIDDERKQRISQYGIGDSYTVRRLKHELGARLDTHVEAEALIEAARKGQAPFMREKPHIAPIEEGKPAELVCYAVGDPPPTIQWFRNDMLLAPNNRLHIIEDNKGRSILRLSSATCIDAGIYKAVARNKMGQTVSRARMVLATVPDAPDSPEACGISDTEILLRWKQPKNDGNSPVFCYSVQFKTVEDADWRDVSNTIDHEFFLVHGLKPSTGYIFRLASRNAIGWGPKGIPTEVIRTSQEGCPPVEMTRTMRHLQAISESGQEVVEETKEELDYSVETKPVEWNRHQPTEKFTFISEIFRGRFSVIVKGIDKTCDKVVVAKVLEYSQSTEQKVNYEFEALRSLRHERIACLLEAYKPLDASFCVFILEKLQGADILTYLSSRHEYTEQMVATIISQVLDALQYLHWRGVCHLDLQPDNVVMSSIRSVQVKLVDMGNAERVSKLGSIVRTNGNMEYTAPEVLCQEPAYPQSDIWSVGVLAYVMLSGVSPFHGNDPGETRQNINFVRYRFEHLYKELTPEATRFLMLVFKRAPNKRPTAEQCHEHRWLLPTEYMIRRRERAVFLGHRLKDYSENYHRAREEEASTLETLTCLVSGKGPLLRSTSIKEELITAK